MRKRIRYTAGCGVARLRIYPLRSCSACHPEPGQNTAGVRDLLPILRVRDSLRRASQQRECAPGMA